MGYAPQKSTCHTRVLTQVRKGRAVALCAGDAKRETLTPSLRGAVNGRASGQLVAGRRSPWLNAVPPPRVNAAPTAVPSTVQ